MSRAKALRNLTDSIGEDDDAKFDSVRLVNQLLKVVGDTAGATTNARLNRAVAWSSVAVSVGALSKSFYDMYKKSRDGQYIIKISEEDEIFGIAEQWLNESMPEEKQQAVFLHSTSRRAKHSKNRSEASDSPYPAHPAGQKDKVKLSVSLDGTVSQAVEILGHQIIIQISVPDGYGERSDKNKTNYVLRSISFVCKSLEARNAVIAELDREAQKLALSSPLFFICSRWGGFNKTSDIPKRPAESVILKEGQMDRIMAHLNTFLANEESYVKLGIPYRTGIMLHGNPGSGKSSTAATIAYELGLNIYYISLSTLDDDDALSTALGNVPSNSVVILEDVDTYHGAVDRDSSEAKGVTMQGLLNGLDGFVAPHGVITIMTTNRLKVLDHAVIRPGRVDLMEELNELDDYQLREIMRQFTGSVPAGLPHITPKDLITSAQIVGQIKSHIPNVHESGPDVIEFIRTKAKQFTNNR
jgi:ATP-dependent 26S proteasome regulatory subunit